MRKLSLLLVMLIFASAQLLAQRTITGKVTDANDGNSIPGVQVVVKGTTTGTVTDLDGKYTVRTPKNDGVLVFSYMGKQTIEIVLTTSNVVDVAMESSNKELEGVVVTALGISREKKSLGYAVEEVKADELNQTRSGNVITSLSGKAAGVNITNASGNMGGSSRITIRGIKSVAGNNQPLFVVDGVPMDNSNYNSLNTARGAGGIDYGSMINDLNPDDIESISVLKGPTAAALYGSRAANGVIQITTKKAKSGQKGLGVEINSSVSFEQIGILPKYQNLYGGGATYSGDGTDAGFILQDINGTNYRLVDYALDESWGPKYDPNVQVLAFNNIFDWEANGKQGNPSTSPWVAPANDVRSFFETGVNFNNNIAISNANDKGSFRLSYTNFDLKGYMPSSLQKKHTISFNGDNQISKMLKAFVSVNYANVYTKGRPETGYSDNNIMQKFNQWGQRQLDMKIMSNYVNPDGTQRVWNRSSWDDPTPAYSDNPYWTRIRNYQDDAKNRVYGNIGFVLTPVENLSIQTKWNLDHYGLTEMERVAIGSQAESFYSETNRNFLETNLELMASYKLDLTEDLSLNLMGGANKRHRDYGYQQSYTVGGLIIPELYKVTNSVNKPFTKEYEEAKEVQSVYGSFNLGYKGLLYLDGTFRNDWSSTLNKPYSYPSISMSFVFTELDALKDNKVINYGKVRLGRASAGNDTDPYSTDYYYTYISNFGDLAMYSIPTTLANPNLEPEKTNSFEAGAELLFFKSRVGLDFTYYNEVSKNQILGVAISGASGYGFKTTNAGKVTNKGIEVLFKVTPVQTKDFNWEISANFSKNKNMIVELAKGLDVYQLANGPFSVSVNAEVGQPYGSIRGSSYVKDASGNLIVNTDGLYEIGSVQTLGNIMPDYLLGIWNTFNYKGIQLSALVDIRKGGKFFSTTSMWGRYSGILEETAVTNANGKNVRDPLEDGGGVLVDGYYGRLEDDGTVTYLDADGNVSATPVKNSTYVDAETWGGWHYDGPAEQNIFDASYMKLRELRIGYTLPAKFTGPIQNLTISAYGRNLAVWGTAIKHVDPENTTSSGNIQGIEGGALPSLRTFGFGLKCNF